MNGYFKKQIEALRQRHEALLQRPNEMQEETNGVIRRYVYPVLTRQHIPLEWRYDFNPATNPCCMERIGFNATMNSGALKWNGKYLMVVRVEGADRKSFFAIAESPNGVDNFHFWKRPLVLPDVDPAETNVYDMRLTAHQDGWIYGIFCSERHDDKAPAGDLSAAVAKAGIVRTRNLVDWERLPDLKAASQQRNVVLHPEFVNGKYALYTRPQDDFINAGNGGGIGLGVDRRHHPGGGEGGNDNKPPLLSHDQRGEERRGTAPHPHLPRMAAPGARSTRMCRRTALCALSLYDRSR